MKNLIKVVRYAMAAALIAVLLPFSAVAANNNENNALSGGQIIGGLALLVTAILVPTMRSARKTKA